MRYLSFFVAGCLFWCGLCAQAATVSVAGIAIHREDGRPAGQVLIGLYLKKKTEKCRPLDQQRTSPSGVYNFVMTNLLGDIETLWVFYEGTDYVASPVPVRIVRTSDAIQGLIADDLYLILRHGKLKDVEEAGARLAAIADSVSIRTSLGLLDAADANQEMVTEVLRIGTQFPDYQSQSRLYDNFRQLARVKEFSLPILNRTAFMDTVQSAYAAGPN